MNGSSKDDFERRKSFRLDMEKEFVDISWQDDNGNEVSKKIVCLDFSQGGLKLECDSEIPVNIPVVITFQAAAKNSQKLFGKVLRCIKQDTGWYEIALQLDES